MAEISTPLETDPKARLLVVDDDPNLRAGMQDLLSLMGYHVEEASSGHEALMSMERAPYDLMVLDIRMPGMNGIEVMEKILSKNKKQMVILNTAYSVYKDNFMTWAADAYIIKSSDLTELKDKVKELLGQEAAS